jgi:2-methylisocitrate lyase-like PEP mutase family enzyme
VVRVITQQQFVNKIRAAVDARTDPNFIIIARSNQHADPEEQIERLAACLEAGADAAWLAGSHDHLRAVARALNKPLVGVLPRDLTLQEYRAIGANCALLPGIMQLVAVRAQRILLEELVRVGNPNPYLASLPGIEEDRAFSNSVGTAEFQRLLARFTEGA